MRLSRQWYFVLMLGLIAAVPSYAQTQTPASAATPAAAVASPYTVTVPVTDTTDVQRNQAFADALGQVLARVAGGQDLRAKTGYADALKGAPGLVQQFQYQRAGAGLAVQVNFEPGAVRRLVTRLGVPAAGVKPPVLLLVHGTDGALLSRDSLVALAQATAARGYTVVYPSRANTPDSAALISADPVALAAVTEQYKTGLILLGDLKSGSTTWTLISGGQPQRWTTSGTSGTSEEAMLAEAGATMVDRLGKQLNVIGANVVETTLWVSDVNSAMDYANMLATLRADPSVREVITAAAQGDGMLLKLKAALPASALAASLAAGGRLLQGNAHDGADASLRWLH